MKVIKTRKPGAVTVDFGAIPSYQTDSMCRILVGSVSRYFEDPNVMADYKRWQQERQQKMKGADT